MTTHSSNSPILMTSVSKSQTAKEIDDIASKLCNGQPAKPRLLTLSTASESARETLNRIEKILRSSSTKGPVVHLGVIYGIGRYIAGIGPFQNPNTNITVSQEGPFLWLQPEERVSFPA